MHRITIQYSAPADPVGFEEHYEDSHIPLVRKLPGLARLTTSHPRALGADAPYLVAELWFEDWEAMKTAMRSPEMADTASDAESLGVPMVMFTGEVVAR